MLANHRLGYSTGTEVTAAYSTAIALPKNERLAPSPLILGTGRQSHCAYYCISKANCVDTGKICNESLVGLHGRALVPLEVTFGR